MGRQENLETASTATSIIHASNFSSDHNKIVIIAKNTQAEPISSDLINLYIGNTLQKAQNLANNQEQAIAPQEALKNLVDMFMSEANRLQKDKELTLPQEDSVDIHKASQGAYNSALQFKEYQILADLWKNYMNSYLTEKLLGHPKT
ncbi:hypothetical protein O181_008469 [Austropuccinia psidii MF-1]|uniref:Uncharacterized protein n=1 Tax=Austropuccinia psidii MF-1 TaxID=1389203 RepID=A0A9Q3BNX5_9BASI|nr:hypothetical protein [Austropuccinia psidii MF-1]